MAYRVGFDVGGTFTDFVLQTPAGELLTAKRLTTYPDPSDACLAGLDELLAQAGVAVEAPLVHEDIERLAHRRSTDLELGAELVLGWNTLPGSAESDPDGLGDLEVARYAGAKPHASRLIVSASRLSGCPVV